MPSRQKGIGMFNSQAYFVPDQLQKQFSNKMFLSGDDRRHHAHDRDPALPW